MKPIEAFKDIKEISNDYLSFVYDYGYYLSLSKYDADSNTLRFFLTGSNKKLVKFKDLKLDIIPFYEYLLSNYNIGYPTKEGRLAGRVRYSTLQIKDTLDPKIPTDLYHLDRRELLDEDLEDLDDKYLSCISFYKFIIKK